MKVIQQLSHQWCHKGGWKGVKYSLDLQQGLQPLNEYDLWVLPTIPWAPISPLQKNLQCLMIPRTLGWAPTLINEPHLRGTSIPGDAAAKTAVLRNPGSPWWWVPVRFVFSPLDVERLSELARQSHYVKFFFPLHSPCRLFFWLEQQSLNM